MIDDHAKREQYDPYEKVPEMIDSRFAKCHRKILHYFSFLCKYCTRWRERNSKSTKNRVISLSEAISLERDARLFFSFHTCIFLIFLYAHAHISMSFRIANIHEYNRFIAIDLGAYRVRASLYSIDDGHLCHEHSASVRQNRKNFLDGSITDMQ